MNELQLKEVNELKQQFNKTIEPFFRFGTPTHSILHIYLHEDGDVYIMMQCPYDIHVDCIIQYEIKWYRITKEGIIYPSKYSEERMKKLENIESLKYSDVA
jgi:hypothetical protein